MVPNTRANGNSASYLINYDNLGWQTPTSGMAAASRSGWTDPATRATDKTTKLMAEGDSFMPMETSMRETGRTTRLTDAEYTLMLMEPDMKESGSRASSTDSVLRGGPMAPHTRDSIFRGRSTAMASLPGLILAHTPATFMITTFTVVESTSGLMAECSLVSGETTRWRAMGPSHGPMAGGMSETTLTI